MAGDEVREGRFDRIEVIDERLAGIAVMDQLLGGRRHVDFRAMFECGAIDIAQPSVTKIGGITEMRKIIALAEGFGVQLVPHCAYFGPGYLASLHIAASLKDETPLERLFMDLEASPFSPYTEPTDGKIPVPQGPGLGCDPDAAVVERYRVR